MKILLFILWSTSISADAITTQHVINNGGYELILPQNNIQRNVLLGAGATGGVFSINYLWKHNHKKQAVILSLIGVGVHSLAAIHNSRIR